MLNQVYSLNEYIAEFVTTFTCMLHVLRQQLKLTTDVWRMHMSFKTILVILLFINLDLTFNCFVET